MYHASGYLDLILDPKNSEEQDRHGDDASEWEAMKVEYGLEDVGHLLA
jgi:histone deacetylase 8